MSKKVALAAALLTLLGGARSGIAEPLRAGPSPRIAFVRSGENRLGQQIWTMRANGSHKRRLTRGRVDSNPAWSPDGRRLVFHRLTSGGNAEVFVMSARGRNATRLTDRKGFDGYATWSPDGTRIAYTRNTKKRGLSRVFVMNADGSESEALTGRVHSSFLPTWSSNGGRIAFVRTKPCERDAQRRCGNALYVMRSDGSERRRVTPFHRFEVMEYPDWSPDGKWIAYDRAGDCCLKTGVYLVRPNGSDRHWISVAEARHPTWSPDGRRIVVDYGTDTPNSDIWVLKRDGTVLDRLTRGPAFDREPAWSGPR